MLMDIIKQALVCAHFRVLSTLFAGTISEELCCKLNSVASELEENST